MIFHWNVNKKTLLRNQKHVLEQVKGIHYPTGTLLDVVYSRLTKEIPGVHPGMQQRA